MQMEQYNHNSGLPQVGYSLMKCFSGKIFRRYRGGYQCCYNSPATVSVWHHNMETIGLAEPVLLSTYVSWFGMQRCLVGKMLGNRYIHVKMRSSPCLSTRQGDL